MLAITLTQPSPHTSTSPDGLKMTSFPNVSDCAMVGHENNSKLNVNKFFTYLSLNFFNI